MSALLLLFAVGPHADTLATGPKAQLLQSLYLQAGRALDKEDPPSALAPIERALPLEREVFGGLRVRRTGWAVWLAQRYIEAERFTDAQELLSEALRYLDHLPADHVKGAKLILISPDGNLARFPFAALPAGAGRYLIEDVELVHVPAPRLPAEPASGGARPPGLLVVGDVSFDAAEGRWRALPATRVEAKATADAFAARFKDGAVMSLGRDRATRPAVLGAMVRSRFVHLATHGYSHPAGDLDPLLRSGLVLAGESGSLTALEVGHADLSGCELAVLSACETGLGQRTGGEGMLGLQRALLVAGCRRVVSSLWNVDDAATSVLMERFYHHLWKEGQTPRAALRLAQLDVLRGPELVEKRLAELWKELPRAEVALVRGLGKVGAPLPKGVRRGPPAWWAGWQMSGDWR